MACVRGDRLLGRDSEGCGVGLDLRYLFVFEYEYER